MGVLIHDTGSDWSISHHQDERFLMTSTFKPFLCGAVLQRAEMGTLDLGEQLEIEVADRSGSGDFNRNIVAFVACRVGHRISSLCF